jgi:hypothetical protein
VEAIHDFMDDERVEIMIILVISKKGQQRKEAGV